VLLVVDPANCLECADKSASERRRTIFEHKPRKFVDVRAAECDLGRLLVTLIERWSNPEQAVFQRYQSKTIWIRACV
jgi:hypothetical protein